MTDAVTVKKLSTMYGDDRLCEVLLQQKQVEGATIGQCTCERLSFIAG